MSFCCTFKGWKYLLFIERKLPENLDKNIKSLVISAQRKKKSSQRNPPKKILPKNFYQKIPPKKFLQKILLKNSQKNSQKIPRNIQKCLRFWKYPSSHLEAKNPFGLVLTKRLNIQKLLSCSQKVPIILEFGICVIILWSLFDNH